MYTVGVSGPAGYTHAVVGIGVENLTREQLVDAAAMFTLGSFQAATVVITSDDDPPPPTTTTTTLAPTTLAPTTSVIDAGAGTLPATGPDDRFWNSALIAAVLLALGGATIFATRRRQIRTVTAAPNRHLAVNPFGLPAERLRIRAGGDRRLAGR
ncbi:MAG: LPXTG-motif cell wall-anchored protein [Myxococcota bacterium]